MEKRAVAILTVRAFEHIWYEPRFVRVMERCHRELELVRQSYEVVNVHRFIAVRLHLFRARERHVSNSCVQSRMLTFTRPRSVSTRASASTAFQPYRAANA